MSATPDMMRAAMSGGAQPPSAMPGAGGPAAQGAQAPGATPPGQSPAAAPMSTPQDKRGHKAAAQTSVHIAVNQLEEALAAFGSESEEGGKILKALNTLASVIAKKDTSDLVPAEILQMVKRMPQMGGGTEVQKQLMKQMSQARAQPAPTQ